MMFQGGVKKEAKVGKRARVKSDEVDAMRCRLQIHLFFLVKRVFDALKSRSKC